VPPEAVRVPIQHIPPNNETASAAFAALAVFGQATIANADFDCIGNIMAG
jgi:hypothetical protein